MKALTRRVRELERLAARRRSWREWCAKWQEERERERLASEKLALDEAARIAAKQREVPKTPPLAPPAALADVEPEPVPLVFCSALARWMPVTEYEEQTP